MWSGFLLCCPPLSPLLLLTIEFFLKECPTFKFNCLLQQSLSGNNFYGETLLILGYPALFRADANEHLLVMAYILIVDADLHFSNQIAHKERLQRSEYHVEKLNECSSLIFTFL